MGGLVIKRAYIMAHQKEEFRPIAHRVRTIIFLATPHRGADLAQLLSKILSLSSGPRPFVRDLHRNSLATQSINNEFPQYSQNLHLYSFYKTKPMAYSLGKSLVIEKDAAVLDYANKTATYLNANHRDIYKYTAITDSNYKIVRNTLLSVVYGLRETGNLSEAEINREQRRFLDSLLGVTDTPKDHLMDVESLRLTRSCEWLVKKHSFRE